MSYVVWESDEGEALPIAASDAITAAMTFARLDCSHRDDQAYLPPGRVLHVRDASSGERRSFQVIANYAPTFLVHPV